MNKQKDIEKIIKNHMKFDVINDEFTIQGDKLYDLSQDIVKSFYDYKTNEKKQNQHFNI